LLDIDVGPLPPPPSPLSNNNNNNNVSPLHKPMHAIITPSKDNVPGFGEIKKQTNKNNINGSGPPICKNFETIPTISDLKKFSDERLQKIKSFKIENKFGCIHWLDSVDLRGLNIDDIVKINNGKYI
jgi:hypothetical protein